MIKIEEKNGIIKNIFILLKPYWKIVLISLICTIIVAVIGIYMPTLTEDLLDNGVMKLDIDFTIKVVIFIIILFMMEQALNFAQALMHIKMQNKVQLNLEVDSFYKIMRMKVEYLKTDGFASIFSTISYDIENIAQVANKSFLILIMQIFKILGGITGLMLINYKLTLFVLILFPLKFVIVNKLTSIKNTVFNSFIDVTERIGMWYGDIMNGIDEVKLWNIYENKKNEYKNLQEERFNLNNKMQVLDEVSDVSSEVLKNIIFNFIYILGISLVLKDEITIGGLITFTVYSDFVMTPISLFMTLKYEVANIKPAFQNYFKFIGGVEENNLDHKEVIEKIPEKISFENVSLAYEEKTVLSNVNIDFKSGDKVAFVGTNGSGKTSLINMLLRFYSPTEGRICIDGKDIRNIDIDEYRDLFAVMSQNSYLFNTTIKENIGLQKDMSPDEIMKECKHKKIDKLINFVYRFPEQFKTKTGFAGSKLSGGEKQKVALIRTLLKKDSSILVLDEATSNCDMESEQLFNELIRNCDRYGFIFVITHRPEVLENMDKVVVLDKGKIIAVDTYDNLIKSESIVMPDILKNN